jgi:hypothetical protein
MSCDEHSILRSDCCSSTGRVKLYIAAIPSTLIKETNNVSNEEDSVLRLPSQTPSADVDADPKVCFIFGRLILTPGID